MAAAFTERFLLLTNEAAVGIFPEQKLNIILSPDGTAAAIVCGEDKKRCLTRFCSTAVAPFVARLLHFRNIHASVPFLCDRFLDASKNYGQSSKISCEEGGAIPAASLCPLKRRVFFSTVAEVLSNDPMTEIVHGRQLTSAVCVRMLPVQLVAARNGCVQQRWEANPTDQCSREQFSLLLQELQPELSSLLALDQYPSSVHFALKVEALDDCTLIVSRATRAKTGGEGFVQTEGVAEGEDDGNPVTVEAWWSLPVRRGMPLPLGEILSLSGDVFTHWSEQVVGEEPFSRCRTVDIHASLLDGMFVATPADGIEEVEEEGAWDEVVGVKSKVTEDGDADAVTLLRKHRRIAIRLLQFREYLQVRRRLLSWEALVAPRGMAVPAQPAGGDYHLRLPDGHLERDDPEDMGADDRIVTLSLPSGAKFRAFPSALPANGEGNGSRPLCYSLLRGVFPDRTHVNVYLDEDVSRGVPSSTVRVLLPDASERSFPLSAFARGEASAASSSSSTRRSISSNDIDAAALHAQVNALLSFHHWASAPPEQRAALMAKMQTMASVGVEAGARSQRHLSVERLRSGLPRAVGTSAPPLPPSQTGAVNVSPPLPSFSVLAPANHHLNTPIAPFIASKMKPSTPGTASACGDRVREALWACQQALQENAKILT